MNICWPFFSIIKLYVQFAWQSKTSLRPVIPWLFRSAYEGVPGFPVPEQKRVARAGTRGQTCRKPGLPWLRTQMWSYPSLFRQLCVLSGLYSARITLAISLVAMTEANKTKVL